MKTIILTTDFSETAENALLYTIELAKTMNASIVLLHVYQPKLNSSSLASKKDEQEEGDTKIIRLLNQKTELPNISFEICVHPRHLVSKTIELAEEKNACLIVFGIPEIDPFEPPLVDPASWRLVKNATTPILMIPTKAKFKIPSKIIFTTDYVELENDQPLLSLLNFTNFFNSKLFVLNVQDKDQKTSSKNVAALLNIRKNLRKANPSIHQTVNENIIDGIEQFVKETDAEIVALIPHKRNFLSNFFNQSITQKMILKSKLPLLSLPEETTVAILEKDIPYNESISLSLPEEDVYPIDIQVLNEQLSL